MSDFGASGGRQRGAAPPPPQEPEEHKAKMNRQLIELLNELRVSLPGVQVLFAFLLTVPFSQRFTRLDQVQRDVYFLAVLATTLAAALLIAPSAYHRLRWQQGDKEHLLLTANRMAIAGIAFLALAMSAVVYVITSVVYGGAAAAGVAAAMAAILVWLWFGLPLARRLER